MRLSDPFGSFRNRTTRISCSPGGGGWSLQYFVLRWMVVYCKGCGKDGTKLIQKRV